MKQYNEARDESPTTRPVEALKGQYVKRKADARKVYKVAGYCPINKAWQLDDCDDISRCIYVKKGTTLVCGFDY